MNADAQPDREALAHEAGDEVEHFESETGDGLGVIGAPARHAARDHIGVADGLDLLQAAPLDHVVEGVEHAVKHRHHLRGRAGAPRRCAILRGRGNDDRPTGSPR